MAVKPIPAGFHTVTPYLVVHNASAAIDFYKRAFGAREVMRMESPVGQIGPAELKVGDSIFMLADEMPSMNTRSPRSLGGTSAGVMLYLENVDATFKQAVAAGATIETPLDDMFWGDRYGKLTDPFGHSWSLATHKEDVAPEEMEARAKEAMAKMGERTRTAS